jgi:transcriptional regulator with PAS, ATPase and Fis domain
VVCWGEDFRLIAASNQNLEAMVEAGRFRKDLFYRLNVIHLHIPPLRERREAIVPMARNIIKQMCQESSLPEIKMDRSVEESLMQYDWPGNVRELYNVVGRLLSFVEGETIHVSDLPFYLQDRKKIPDTANDASLRNITSSVEKDAVLNALSVAGNNKAKAAKLLGIHRTHLYKKMKKYKLI